MLEKLKDKKSDVYIDICVFFIIMVVYSGIHNLHQYIICFLLNIVFMYMIYKKGCYTNIFFNKSNIYLLVFVTYFVIMSLDTYSIESIIYRSMLAYITYYPFVIYEYYKCRSTIKIVFVTNIIIVFFLINAVIYYSNDIYLVRQTVSGVIPIVENVGGDPYAFCISVDSIALFYLIDMFNARFVIRIYEMFFFVVASMFTLYTDSGTIIIVYFFCVCIGLLSIAVRRYGVINVGGFLFILSLLVFFITELSLNEEISIGGPFLQLRLQQLQEIVLNMDLYRTGGSFVERIELRQNSWNTFCDNFLIGVWGDKYEFSEMTIGAHCEVVDLLAKFGIIGTSCLFMSIYYSLKRSYSKEYIHIIVYMIFLSFMNPLQSINVFFSLLFVVPLLISYAKRNNSI